MFFPCPFCPLCPFVHFIFCRGTLALLALLKICFALSALLHFLHFFSLPCIVLVSYLYCACIAACSFFHLAPFQLGPFHSGLVPSTHVHTRKSGTAILLFRILRLWYCLYFQTATPKPTPICMYTRTYACTYNTHHEHLSVAMSWKLSKFTRFQNAKTKRI